MTAPKWGKRIAAEIAWVKRQMRDQKMGISELAFISNIATKTLVSFLEGLTYSPHKRVFDSIVEALGYKQAKIVLEG
jgi:hypothetical protein